MKLLGEFADAAAYGAGTCIAIIIFDIHVTWPFIGVLLVAGFVGKTITLAADK